MMKTETSIYAYAKENLQSKQNKAAIWFYGNTITFKELFERIDAVAGNLADAGVQCADVVTLHAPNCPQAIIAVYALAKIGAISNIVHPLTPLYALKKNMQETKSVFLITSDAFDAVDQIDFAEKVYCIRIGRNMGIAARLALKMKSRFHLPANAADFGELEKPNDNAHVFPYADILSEKCVCYMHSSGSTGTPKTVMHSHKSINNWVENYRCYRKDAALPDDAVFSSFLPLFHGAGFAAGMHTQISCGWKMVLAAKINMKQIFHFIQKQKVTDVIAVPSMYAEFLKLKHFNKRTTKRIQCYYVGADTMLPEMKKAILEKSCNATYGMFELYGISETVLGCFMTGPRHNNIYAAGYNHSYPHCDIAVINEKGFFRKNAEGELVVSTNTMMMGYLNDEEATNNTFFERGGKKWIRSGDWGEIDANGYVYFKHRIKNVIIRKGMNIYPEEVERCIQELAFVRDVCVVGPSDPQTGSQYVRACVVLREDKTADEQTKRQIQKQVSDHLLKHCTPEEIVFMDALPRLKIGKIDRKKCAL